jgi:hypothetical protein
MFNHDVNKFHQNVAFRMEVMIGGGMKGVFSKV